MLDPWISVEARIGKNEKTSKSKLNFERAQPKNIWPSHSDLPPKHTEMYVRG